MKACSLNFLESGATELARMLLIQLLGCNNMQS